jgi:hypothetical protein
MSAHSPVKGEGNLAYPTHNNLPEDARSSLIDILEARLADAIDLHT